MDRNEAIEIVRMCCPKIADSKCAFETAMRVLFPELKESEDERIRTKLLNLLKELLELGGVAQDTWSMKDCEQFIAWLEKQGESKPIGKLQLSEELYEHIRNTCACIDDAMSSETLVGIKDYLEQASKSAQEAFDMVEKQGSQNLANKVVPKYEIGDVIRIKNSNHEFIISRITDGYYHSKGAFIEIRIADDVNGDWEYARHIQPEPKFNVGDWVIHCSQEGILYQVEKVFLDGTYRIVPVNDKIGKAITAATEDAIRLWTIQDAKDGDVLVYEDEISIYRYDIKNCTTKDTSFGGFVYHCCYDGKRFFTDSLYSLTKENASDIYPATKEQRDIIFQKMKEAGYEWDSEKKELRKIEQNPAWSEEDDINLGKAIWYVENPASMVVKDSMLVEWLKSFKDRVGQPQPKQEWTEEDEANLQFAIDDFQFCVDNNQFPVVYNTEKHKEVLALLKSLKERYTWKPSDEQMKILQYLCETSSHPNEKVIPTLQSLYNDLKKLKG